MGQKRKSRQRDTGRGAGKGSRARRPSALRIAVVGLVAFAVLGFLLWPEGEAGEARPESVSSAPDVAATERPDRAVAAPSTPPLDTLEPERLAFRVLSSRPHDPEAYTQGLLWHDGYLYESTGLNGRSSLRKVDPESGEVLERFDLADEFFGEGIARIDDRIVQLTWKKGVAFEYDLESFERTGSWSYTGDGWGLCSDGERLFMTDGSPTLAIRSRDDFSVIETRTITLRGRPQGGVNELECVEDDLYGNVYGTEVIVRIDPETGRIDGVVDARDLLPASDRAGVDVMNGIAYDPEERVFYLTGKLWPKLFEVVIGTGAPTASGS